ncbi:MAG: hypothetical protein JWQ40_246, partial [Segetibacter sp.]|nr:hypothetical protein [Segetibacter sp.]
ANKKLFAIGKEGADAGSRSNSIILFTAIAGNGKGKGCIKS